MKEKGKLYNLFPISDGGAALIENLLEDIENLDLYDDVDFFIQEFIQDEWYFPAVEDIYEDDDKDWENFFIWAIMSAIAEDFRVKLSEYIDENDLNPGVIEYMELGVDINSTCSEFYIEINCNGEVVGFNADDIIYIYTANGIEDAYEELKRLYEKYNVN